jgi:organic radical activating enzyme
MNFKHLYIQPMDGPDQERNTHMAIEFCKSNPEFKLSLQTHKYLDIP